MDDADTRTWRDRALEAEARLAEVRRVTERLHAVLFPDDADLDTVTAVLDAPTPTVAVGQIWEISEFGITRQAVVLHRDSPTWRPHDAGATFWRLRSRRGSTIREDVLRKRWRLVRRADAIERQEQP